MTQGVLILTPYFFPVMGGVESNAERLGRFLAGEGVPVQVLTKRITRDRSDLEERNGMTIRRIGPRGERSALGKWQLVPAALVWLLRHSARYDVVCCIDYRATGVAALIARGVTRRPVVFQAQTTGVVTGENADPALRAVGIDPAGAMGRACKRPIRAFYRRADAIACISHGIEREALDAGVVPSRVHYFPNAIDMTAFRPAEPGESERLRQALGVSGDAVVCLFVGRLSREKGLEDLLEAWRLLTRGAAVRQPSGLDADGGAPASTQPVLLVAGPDMTGHPWDVGATGRAFVARHGLAGSVRFLGPIADVAPLYRAVDVAVQPSHFEALGLSAIEALASGVPVVAAAVGGLLEFVVDGHNGRLCPPHDPERLSACLASLVADRDERRRLARNARASVHDQFDERLVFGRMRDLFERLAAHSAGDLPPERG